MTSFISFFADNMQLVGHSNYKGTQMILGLNPADLNLISILQLECATAIEIEFALLCLKITA